MKSNPSSFSLGTLGEPSSMGRRYKRVLQGGYLRGRVIGRDRSLFGRTKSETELKDGKIPIDSRKER
jgi:hypothetical protein